MNDIRIDKWLWTMRLFKTRSVAADACTRGRVLVEGVQAKPSKMVKVGDVVSVKRPPVTFSFKIKALAPSRLGAKLVPDYMQQVTTADQLRLWEIIRLDQRNARAKGLGRPTKKDRRSLDEFIDDTPYYIDEYVDFDDEDDIYTMI